MKTFIESAASLETSIEIARAIELVAFSEGREPYNVWSCPSDSDIYEIKKIVTERGKFETTDFFWGSADYDWYPADILTETYLGETQ